MDSSSTDTIYTTFKTLHTDVQNHTFAHKYAVTKKQSKNNKNNKLIKVVLICNWGHKPCGSAALIWTHTTLWCFACSFKCVTALIKKTESWLLHIVNSEYNHSSSESASIHSEHHKKQLTEICVQKISHKIYADLLPH